MADAQALARERQRRALDAVEAMAALNVAAKADSTRQPTVYRLKRRLVAALWREGYCMAAEYASGHLWLFTFVVGQCRVCWHLPAPQVDFEATVFSAPQPARLHAPRPPAASTGERLAAVRAYLRLVGG
jgi:hypothetical protein